MEAGRSLDALVAEKVMGIRVNAEQGDYWPPARPGANFSTQPIPPYSTSIEAAWSVVERVNTGKRLWFSVSRSKNGRPNVCIDFNDEDVIEGDSVPHAICLAALEAVKAAGA